MVESSSTASRPSAGLAGDVKAGFLVFLIALPLCLGIAMASGFPPVAGVLTAIIGGIVVSWFGNARLTIKGPAAGLIVIALGAVQDLGQGDAILGYRRALAVGAVAAAAQIVFALLGVATAGIAMSPSVVHGMLAAIGVIIVSKQVHTVVGVAPDAKEPLHLLLEIPRSIAHANPEILAIGGLSLLVLFGLPLIKSRWARSVPAPMVVLAVTVPLGLWFDLDHSHTYSVWSGSYHVGPEYLVQLPGSLLDALAFPDFSVVFSPTSLQYVIMFALVGTIESTLSVLAVDSMDPAKHASDLNKDLLGVGVGNLISSLVGGLPMISEIVRSRANVDAGAQSRWSNFTHGFCLLAFVALVPGLLHEIPLAALGAMLVYTGVRLASPKEVMHAKSIGLDQAALFLTTLFTTLATDLLIGVAVGLVLKVTLHLLRGASFRGLFTPKVEAVRDGDVLRIVVHGAAAFPTLLKVRHHLHEVSADVRHVRVDLSETEIVDHTFISRLESMADEWPQAKLELVGEERLRAVSAHPHAFRRRHS